MNFVLLSNTVTSLLYAASSGHDTCFTDNCISDLETLSIKINFDINLSIHLWILFKLLPVISVYSLYL